MGYDKTAGKAYFTGGSYGDAAPLWIEAAHFLPAGQPEP